MLFVQRVDLIVKMLVEGFPDLTCSLFTNNWHPDKTDELNNYSLISSLKLKARDWETEFSALKVCAVHKELNYERLNKPIYGYVVRKGKTLLWAERFSNGPFGSDTLVVLLPNLPSPSFSIALTPKISIFY